MYSITHQSNAPSLVIPTSQDSRRPVVQVPNSNFILLGCPENVVNLLRPALEDPLQVSTLPVRHRFRVRAAWIAGQERIPLVHVAANVGDDEVLLRADVHLVANFA